MYVSVWMFNEWPITIYYVIIIFGYSFITLIKWSEWRSVTHKGLNTASIQQIKASTAGYRPTTVGSSAASRSSIHKCFGQPIRKDQSPMGLSGLEVSNRLLDRGKLFLPALFDGVPGRHCNSGHQNPYTSTGEMKPQADLSLQFPVGILQQTSGMHWLYNDIF